ncbi:MAG: alpha/beta hydrolase [Clostridia bacterium]|nr:alpha/beta hydrolase [Clostridia bacterium]
MSFNSLWIKYQFKKSDDKRDEGLVTPAGIVRDNNISYGPHKKNHVLDVYRPKNIQGKLPVLINIHGGGWVYGTKETYQYYLMSLAQKGFVVVNPNYGLAPKYKFPSQLEDINQVVHWTITEHEKYGMDLNHIFLVGDSAGAHLTTLYTHLCTNPSYRVLLNISPPKDFKPNGVLLNCGVYKMPITHDKKEIKKNFLDFLGKNNLEEKLSLIDPLNYFTKEFPPTFIMSSTGDFLLDHVEALEQMMLQNKIKHVVKIYGDDIIKPPHVFHCNIKSPLANQCNEEQSMFLKSLVNDAINESK